MTTKQYINRLASAFESIGNDKPTVRPHKDGGWEMISPYRDERIIAVVTYKRSFDEYRVGRVSEFLVKTCGNIITGYSDSDDIKRIAHRIEYHYLHR